MDRKITSNSVTLNLKALGKTAEYPSKADRGILETFDSPSEANLLTVDQHNFQYVIFRQDEVEFTSLCPVTGQPDFGKISILYLPKYKYVESKSLKLYLFSFRNEQGFGEAIVNKIAQDLLAMLDAKFVVVKGDFNPRGGIRWTPKSIMLGHGTNGYLYKLTETDVQIISQF